MGVKIRKRDGKWYVFVNYHGRRKAKCVGTSWPNKCAGSQKRNLLWATWDFWLNLQGLVRAVFSALAEAAR
jgi:hypothetical protein